MVKAKATETTSTKKAGCEIKRCSCPHPFQDALYGVGMRVINLSKNGKHRCTVCSTQR